MRRDPEATGAMTTLPQAFADWATVAPGAEVLATHQRTVTVGEMAALAGGLLERLPLSDGRPVIVAARDAIELAVSLLAANGAGSPIVPVDPRRSATAIAELATRLGARVLLTGAAGSATESAFLVAGMRVLDPSAHPGDAYRPGPVGIDDTYGLLATSGSTGEPKYVEGTHRALLNGLHSESAGPPFLSEDRVARIFNHAGLTVNMVGTNMLRRIPTLLLDPRAFPIARFLPLLAEHRITYAHYTPSMLRNAVRAAKEGTFLPDMRVIGGGGEPMSWGDVASIRRVVGPGCVVFHSYGATECGPIARNVIPADRPLGDGVVPVGRPVDGRRVWIDAGDGTPAAPDTLGEIIVEGDLGRRSPNIAPTADGLLRYRTGDLGRFDASGELHHSGRSDRMVKIGGVRIEPAAVESVLRDLPGVVDVAVVTVDLGPDTGRRLIAHVVIDADTPLDAERLRSSAAERLTSTAVPSRFVLRTEPLPLLATGKVDHEGVRRDT